MKTTMRNDIREKRDSLAPSEIEALSAGVKESLFSANEFRDARTVMFYSSTGSEVRTDAMIEESIQMGKEVLLPRIEGRGLSMSARKIKSFRDDARPGTFGIREPTAKCPVVPHSGIDLVIVPGTAFDTNGERLGYGKGYYDRFLAKVPNAKSIGLAYDFQVVRHVPRERHDAKVDVIVTEKRIIRAPVQQEAASPVA